MKRYQAILLFLALAACSWVDEPPVKINLNTDDCGECYR
jgi:hypothetical protein